MTHLEKLNAVREAVIAAVPEIMELKFGCVITSAAGDRYRVIDLGFGKVYAKQINDLISGSFHTFVYNTYEIIGRPIQLADVLRAMQGNEFEEETVDALIYGHSLDESIRWDLSKTLDQQPPETIDFLHSILCKSV